MRLRRLLAAAAIAAGLALSPAAPAAAHSAGASAVVLDVRDDTLAGRAYLPVTQAGLATAGDLTPGTLRRYVADRLTAHSTDGQWRTDVSGPEPVTVQDQAYLMLPFTLTPPDGAVTSAFTLHVDVIVREVRSHDVAVYTGETGGNLDESRLRLVGVADHDTTTVDVDAHDLGFGATVVAGAGHVLAGLDHLLFVAMLLLPAPLLAAGRSWRGRRSARSAAARAVHVVTAFTAGHSATLAAVALTGADVASRWLETLVALSVAAAAAHAIRPLIRAGEVWLAGGFGLVHGLAFAGLLRDVGGSAPGLGTLLAFNLGVELAQLVVIAALLPPLLLLAAGPRYRPVRVGLAGAGLIAALCWAAERAFGTPNPLLPALDAVAAHPGVAAAALAVAAAADLLARRSAAASPAVVALAVPTSTDRR
jgi:hypothetical protein